MLDWDARPTKESVVDLDLYEKARPKRRNRRELKLSFEARRRVLENERGFSVEEVKKAWSEVSQKMDFTQDAGRCIVLLTFFLFLFILLNYHRPF